MPLRFSRRLAFLPLLVALGTPACGTTPLAPRATSSDDADARGVDATPDAPIPGPDADRDAGPPADASDDTRVDDVPSLDATRPRDVSPPDVTPPRDAAQADPAPPDVLPPRDAARDSFRDPDVCHPLPCDTDCLFGQARDDRGCEVCACALPELRVIEDDADWPRDTLAGDPGVAWYIGGIDRWIVNARWTDAPDSPNERTLALDFRVMIFQDPFADGARWKQTIEHPMENHASGVEDVAARLIWDRETGQSAELQVMEIAWELERHDDGRIVGGLRAILAGGGARAMKWTATIPIDTEWPYGPPP